MKHRLIKSRLIVNGIFCIGVIILFVPVFMNGILMVLVPNPEWSVDDEGAAKAQMLSLFTGVFVLGAAVSLARTVKRLRELARAGNGGPDDVA